jgi:hypothetical protein
MVEKFIFVYHSLYLLCSALLDSIPKHYLRKPVAARERFNIYTTHNFALQGVVNMNNE